MAYLGKVTKVAKIVAVSVAMTSPVIAQENNRSTPEDDNDTETIIVTATKRQQTLLETPVAVSVVSAESIERAAIQDILDLQSLVPSFSVDQRLATTTANFYIRGFGNGISAIGIEPSVGVFIDGVYRSRASAALTDFPRLERVEVLRGPQSTLFGKNASAGVVSFVSKAPKFEWESGLEATAGNYGATRFGGDITGPISETMAFSLSGRYNTRDGYATNLFTGDELNDRDRWGLRGQLLWLPGDKLSVRLIADADEIDENCCISSNLIAAGSPTGVFSTLGAFSTFGDVVVEDPFSYDVYANVNNNAKLETSGVSLHVDYDFDGYTVTSITALRDVDFSSKTDSDGTSFDVTGSGVTGKTETFTQELRITSDSDDAMLDWMVGAFYFSEDVESQTTALYSSDSRQFYDLAFGGDGSGATVAFLEPTFGLPAGALGDVTRGIVDSFAQENETLSLFGTLDWHVTERLDLTVGMNWSDDTKDVVINSFNNDLFSFIPSALLGPAAALQFFAPMQPLPNNVEDGRSEDDKITYTLRAAYELSENINMYGSYATGWKATSWNLSRESRPNEADFTALTNNGSSVVNLRSGTRLAGPENSEVVELGIKGMLSDSWTFDLTLFDQTIKGFQSNVFDGENLVLSNAGEQSTKGVEFETNLEISDNLTLGLSATWLDPVFDDFSSSPFGDLSGRRPANIPTWSTSTRIAYETEIDGWKIFTRADYQFTDDSPLTDDPNTQALIDTTNYDTGGHLINASAGFIAPNDIEVMFWVRNLFEEEFITGAFGCVLQFGSVCGYPNEPRTYGVTVRRRF